MKEMVLAKAKVTTATEAGTFSAIISTVRPDREGDVVLPEAVVDALQAWGTKSIPLAWQHRAEDPDEIVGHIVRGSVKAIDGEVQASGWVDRDTPPRGKQVWRLVKSNTLGFSYGYLILDAVKRADGNREIRKIDVFEISATPTPMSAETRVLDWRAPSNPSPRCHHPRSSAPAHANSSASSVS